MTFDFTYKLIELGKRKRLVEKLKHQIEEIERIAVAENKTLEMLKLQLQNEKESIEELKNSFSFSKMFSKVSSKYEKNLTSAEKEYYEIQANYLRCENYIEELNSTKNKAKDKILEMGNVEILYTRFLDKYKRYIATLDYQDGNELYTVLDALKMLEIQQKDISELTTQGNDILPLLENLMENLDCAYRWCVNNIGNNDIISNSKKFIYLDNATKHLNKIRVALNKYRGELKNLDIALTDSLFLDEKSKICDILYATFSITPVVQEKIHLTRKDTADLKHQILTINMNLNKISKDNEVEIKQLRIILKSLLETQNAKMNI